MKMKGFWLGLAVGTIFTCLLGQWVFSAASKETDPPRGISPEIVAEYIHSVVQADRTFYTTEIVDRMQRRGIVSRLGTLERRPEISLYPPNLYWNRGGSWLNNQRNSIPADQQLGDKWKEHAQRQSSSGPRLRRSSGIAIVPIQPLQPRAGLASSKHSMPIKPCLRCAPIVTM